MKKLSSSTLALVCILIAIAGIGGYAYGAISTSGVMNASPAGHGEIHAVAPLEDGTYDAMIYGASGPLNTQEDVLNIHRRNINDPFALGAIDAPVVMSVFSDFECPYCSLYENNVEPALVEEYVNKGLLRIEWNDMPINGDAAIAGAKAGRAAAKQGKFNEFKTALYAASANVQGHPNFTIDDYVKFAQEAGVKDIDQFKADATGTTYDQVVQEALQYGAGLGVSGTPSFLIGETFLTGAQPVDQFQQVINQELKKVQAGLVTVPEQARKDARS